MEKQLKNASISKKEVMKTRLMIQGEPSLDIPIDLSPGEVGVVYQIQSTDYCDYFSGENLLFGVTSVCY